MTKVLVAFGVAFLLGGVTLGSYAQDAATRLLGIRSSHLSVESYEMSLGVTALGLSTRPQKIEEVREQLNYPHFYGDLLGLTAHGERAVFWFVDSGGAIRNVVLDAAASRLYRVEKFANQKLEVDVVRQLRGK